MSPQHQALAVALALLLALIPAGEASAGERRSVVWRLGPLELLGAGPSLAELGLGAFDVLDEGDATTSGAGQLQLRYGRRVLGIGPVIGIMGNTDGGAFGYGGIYADVAWNDVVITPVLALGGYNRGRGKDLGGVFRSEGEVLAGTVWARAVGDARIDGTAMWCSDRGARQHVEPIVDASATGCWWVRVWTTALAPEDLQPYWRQAFSRLRRDGIQLPRALIAAGYHLVGAGRTLTVEYSQPKVVPAPAEKNIVLPGISHMDASQRVDDS